MGVGVGLGHTVRVGGLGKGAGKGGGWGLEMVVQGWGRTAPNHNRITPRGPKNE